MQLPSSQAFRLEQQIELTETAIKRMKAQILYTELALKFGLITTWMLYFIFVMGFYVADLWGLTTWLEQNTSEYVAFLLFLSMAILMATTLSIIKHVFYEHIAEFRYGIGIVILIAALGVFFELFTASSQQQNIAYSNAEQSESFKTTANTSINLGGNTDHSSRIAYLEGELATAQTYLSNCKKTCTHYSAKVASLAGQIQSLRNSQTSTQSNAAHVAVATLQAKTAALKDIRDDHYKPVFKFVRDNFSVTISTAVVLIAALIAAGFEFSHALLSRILGEKLAALAGLQNQLINQKTHHLETTDETATNSATVTPSQTKNAIGFGLPQVATALSPSEPTRFKYQAEDRKVDKTPTAQKQGFIGFVNPEQPPVTQASHPVHRVTQGSILNKLGKAEEQLPLPPFAEFKARRDVFASPALSPEEPTPPPCAQGTQGMQGSNPVHRVEATLYEQWLQAIYSEEIKPSVTESRPWLQKKVAGVGSQAKRKTPTPVDINLIIQGYFHRATTTPTRIRLNPKYRNGLAKYILINEAQS
ncbi:hypothetical protein [uncultured Thiothrix sp.]|uniref:hypothetical protein n=1 Tax=uncultured Thiothrix sp. TaxID=223185 RepID=UPI00261814BC|nr:hypothetical protein [uncultured Thiothrix sp.]